MPLRLIGLTGPKPQNLAIFRQNKNIIILNLLLVKRQRFPQ
jgi:hypothetical protein